MKKLYSKIPGILPPPPKSEIDGKIENLTSKSVPELLELRDRQQKLLGNKVFISKLIDKGDRIQSFLDKINAELKAKQEEEQACKLFSKLDLNPIDKNALQNVEWVGRIQKNENTFLDSDDDSEPEDVIQILSQNTAQKNVKVLKPDKPLITPEDIIRIDEVRHVKYIVEKTEHKVKPKATGNFKPFKTTASDVHNPEKEILRKKHKHWEITAATPPPIVHGPAKVLSIKESLKLQSEYNVHLKKVEAEHAAEKLLARTGIRMNEIPSDVKSFGKYRTVDSDDSESEQSDPEGSDKEVHDEEPERGGVVFTVMK